MAADLASARGWVYWAVAISCIVRLLLLCHSAPLSYDEDSAFHASRYPMAQRFWEADDWGERWHIVAAYGVGAKIFWALGHVLWGKFFPTTYGESASSLTAVCALVMMLVLAGAARNLAGVRGWLTALLIISLSPLFTNYSIRNLGTMQSVMWLCVSLLFFTSRFPGWVAWMGGGLGFGLAFGAHYGSGIPILCTGIALIPGLPYKLFARRGGLKGWAKFREVVLWPALGVACALAPLLLIEAWARYSNDSYIKRVTHHENLNLNEDLGPYGLWLRYLFELDPLVPILVVGAVAAVLSTSRHPWWRKFGLLIPLAGSAGLLCVALKGDFSLRAAIAISILLLLSVPFISYVTARPQATDEPPEESVSPMSPRIPPLGPFGLWLGVVVLMALFTYGREVSGMARLLFTGWPILILGLACLLAKTPQGLFCRWTQAVACLGGIFFLISMIVLLQAKASPTMALEFARWNKNYFDYRWDLFVHPHEYAAIDDRVDNNFVVVGQTSWLWPASAYEEEYFKIKEMRETMRSKGFVDQAKRAEFLIQNFIFFPMKPPANPVAGSFAGFGNSTVVLEGRDVEGRPSNPNVHPWRGVHLFIPGGEYPNGAEVSAVLEVPAHPDDNLFGFTVFAQAPQPPAGSVIELILESAGTSHRRQLEIADMRPGLATIGDDHPRPFRAPLSADSTKQPVKVIAKLAPLPGVRIPSFSVYLSQPFFFRESKPKENPLIFIASDQFADRYASFNSDSYPLMFTRAGGGQNLTGVKWKTGASEPDEPGTYYFAGSFELDPQCQIVIQDIEHTLEFAPQAKDGEWSKGPITISYRHLGTKEGNHGIFKLRLDPAVIPPQPSFDIQLKVVGGFNGSAWFGLRDIPEPQKLYSTSPQN